MTVLMVKILQTDMNLRSIFWFYEQKSYGRKINKMTIMVFFFEIIVLEIRLTIGLYS